MKKGDGGYKIATQAPEWVKELFSHPRAKELAISMGEISGTLTATKLIALRARVIGMKKIKNFWSTL